MSEHYSGGTVSASKFCSKCGKSTQHRIDNHRIGPCLECIAKLERDYQAQKPPAAEQRSLWGEVL